MRNDDQGRKGEEEDDDEEEEEKLWLQIARSFSCVGALL